MLEFDAIAAIARAALAGGATRHSLSRFEWDIAGRCQRPDTVEHFGRPYPGNRRARYLDILPGGPIPLWVTMHVKCRRCAVCLRNRRNDWAARARREAMAAQRTWFGTLTLSPEVAYQALCRAELFAEGRGVTFVELPKDEQFRRVCAEVYPDIQKFMKRVRKLSGAKLRYLCVGEEHKSGEAHFHMLLHEVKGSPPVSWAQLKHIRGDRDLPERQWPLGWSKWEELRHNARAGYVAKYLSKDILDRPRASKYYGSHLGDDTPTLSDNDISKLVLHQRWIARYNGTGMIFGRISENQLAVCGSTSELQDEDEGNTNNVSFSREHMECEDRGNPEGREPLDRVPATDRQTTF